MPLPDRRRLLRATAAVAAATAGAMVTAKPASANNGQNLIIGQANNGTATTSLTGSQLSVANGNAGVAIRAAQSGTNGHGINVEANGSGATAIVAQSINGGGSWGIYAYAAGNDGIMSETYKTGAAGVRAFSFNGTGVIGEVNQGTGVHGISPNAVGVHGETTGGSQPAVYGEAKGAGAGVTGEATTGPALYGYSESGPSLLLDGDAPMPPTTGTWLAGSVVFNAGLWLCLVGGTGAASKWVKLSRTFVPLDTPVRIYDSRPGQPPLVGVKTQLLDGQERDIAGTTGGAVPAGLATALSVNLTVTNTGPAGFVSLYKNGIAWPGTSSINWGAPGTTIANGTIVAVDAAGTFTARAKSSCDLVIDVLGYYT